MKASGPLKGSNCDSAASDFRRLADKHPALLIARHNEAAVYLECGRKGDAMKIWEDLARKPYGPALTNLGYAAAQNGDSVQAERYFTQAIQADPQVSSIAARINLAQILRDRARRSGGSDKNKMNVEAITHLRAVLALDGNSLQAYANLCYLYFDVGLPDAAILIGRQAIKRAEEIATGKFDEDESGDTGTVDRSAPAKPKGKGKGKDKDEEVTPKAARQVTAVQGTGWTIDMKKHIAVVYNTLGLVSLTKRSTTEALANFRKAVDMDPELFEARLNLASVSLKFRDYVTAEDNFRAVIAGQPKNYEAIIGLGVALRGNRKFDDAEQQYLAAGKLDPNRPDSYFNLGLLYQEYKGNDRAVLQKAQQYYRDYLSRGGSSPAVMRKNAEKRIKDIDELFLALQEAEKMQREAEELQKKADEQQKKMEQEIKKQEESEKKAAPASAAEADKKTEPASASAAVSP
jgi:tetratricopeptide (TPR) repeat protein